MFEEDDANDLGDDVFSNNTGSSVASTMTGAVHGGGGISRSSSEGDGVITCAVSMRMNKGERI